MSSRLVRTISMAVCALVLSGFSLGLTACGLPWASTATTDPKAIVSQAAYQLQAALGLADGAITRFSQPPILGDSDIALRWLGGRADMDVATGHLRAILVDTAAKASSTLPGTPLADAELDNEAKRVVALLGWDSGALENGGFTPADTKTVDYGEAGTVYQKSWAGHDSEGIPNQGVIEIGLDAADGDLHSFLYSPGPEIALDLSKAMNKDNAVKAATEAAAKAASARATVTTATEGTSTSTTAHTGTTAKAATTAPKGVRVQSATLVHTDDAGITGGNDLLVWVVKLSGDTATGRPASTVYLDGITGKTLAVMTV